jgi:ABC-type glycerol-3-phosphate transport system substrate-binding protein
MDIMKDIGYSIPDDWTIQDFMTMAEKVKQKYNGKKWATGMFAANQSGDYLINNWFAAFGAKFYDGDYTKTVIKSSGGAKAYAFFQELVKKGYIQPNSATLTDDDYALSWSKGELAATAFFEPWTTVYFKSAIEQGLIEKPFEYKFVPFPRAAGVDRVPTYMMYGAYVVHKTGTEADAIAARLAEHLNSRAMQEAYIKKLPGNAPSRKDVIIFTDNQRLKELSAIVAKNGLFDVGLTSPKFPMTRPTHFPVLQKVLNLEVTPEEGITEYEAAFNAALK